jgi:hypothetical protein
LIGLYVINNDEMTHQLTSETARPIIKMMTEDFFKEHGEEANFKRNGKTNCNLYLWPRPTKHFFLAIYPKYTKDPKSMEFKKLQKALNGIGFPVYIINHGCSKSH